MQIKLAGLKALVSDIAHLCNPKKVVICDGSDTEYRYLIDSMCASGQLTRLKGKECYYAKTHPDDVARVEECVFICSQNKEGAGPTNRWVEPKEMKERLHHLFKGCMKGRVMYVIPYSMGMIGSKFAKYGIEITDSPYVVVNMKIMTRMGKKALEQIEKEGDFIPGIHSVGVPLEEGMQDSHWPCNPKKVVVAHFPETREIWSFGSGYGGNALIGKKCLALRIASAIAHEEGWLAEHMLIMGVKNPSGKKKYFAAAFPSSCGKTNLAMMLPSLPGWEVSCVGDDIAWLKFNEKGQLYAMNPEHGFFGVAPGTSLLSNPYAIKTIEKNTIFTNVALTADLDVWWEGLTEKPPLPMSDWLGAPWYLDSKTPAAHPNSRFTAPIEQCPVLDEKAFDPEGVPIDAIIFGGRRSSFLPLALQARNFAHGVLMGASLTSETTAATTGALGQLRHDPFAMLPFCGYHMGDYFAHWLKMEKPGRKMPPIFSVNWFRKGKNGKWLWPGYGENIRVLKWIFDRTEGHAEARKEAIGDLPLTIDTTGIKLEEGAIETLLHVDRSELLEAVQEQRSYFALFGDKLPQVLSLELNQIEERGLG